MELDAAGVALLVCGKAFNEAGEVAAAPDEPRDGEEEWPGCMGPTETAPATTAAVVAPGA